ncbi:hypothetical protein BDR04DRAFT_1231664 [Suillus decipiens]|nr:hypothetical protein BDR04DRAFT_1231664 [Suillus decipiens]
MNLEGGEALTYAYKTEIMKVLASKLCTVALGEQTLIAHSRHLRVDTQSGIKLYIVRPQSQALHTHSVSLNAKPKRLTFGDTKVSGLTQEDLTMFINSAEWIPASSVSNDSVLHFVLFTPSETHEHCRPTIQGSFCLNGAPVFRNFAIQVAALLGVPPVPLGLSMEDSSVLFAPVSCIAEWARQSGHIA